MFLGSSSELLWCAQIAKHTPKEEQGTENREEDLLIELVHPGALNAAAQIGEDVGEMRGQLQKQRARVAELRIRKLEDPGALATLSERSRAQAERGISWQRRSSVAMMQRCRTWT